MDMNSFITGFIGAIVIMVGVRLWMLYENRIKNFVHRVKDRIFTK